jgi:indole-3-glycerol phosphate synthase
MKTILKKIVAAKKNEISEAKRRCPLAQLKARALKQNVLPRDFRKHVSGGRKLHCIGELKIASPLKGYLCRGMPLLKTARLYEKCGIDALSVLTDSHFKGKLADIKKVKKVVRLPVLRKDFIIDAYQIYESYLAGADAILLIAALLGKKKLLRFLHIAHTLGLEAIVEVHSEHDLAKVDLRHVRIIGINNRNLNDFTVNLEVTQHLISKIPKRKVIVSESGITMRSHILFLKKLGVNAVLIGEGIVTASNMRKKIGSLLGN